LEDTELLGKLSKGDMIAQDALYHSECLIKLYKTAQEINNEKHNDNLYNQIHGTAFAELVCYMVDCTEEEKNTIFKLADLTRMYQNRITELGGQITGIIHTTRLKKRLLAHFEDLKESKEGKNVFLVFDSELGAVLKQVFESSFDDDALVLARAATILRKELFAEKYQRNSSVKRCSISAH